MQNRTLFMRDSYEAPEARMLEVDQPNITSHHRPIRRRLLGGYEPSSPWSHQGRWSGTQRSQVDAIQRPIIDKRPEQHKMDFFLWSRAAVGQLIKQEYGIKLPARSVGKYLARRGFTPPPASHQRAKREGAEIHWGDVMALTNTDVRGRSYAPAGKTLVALAVGGTRQKLIHDRHRHQPRQDPLDGH